MNNNVAQTNASRPCNEVAPLSQRRSGAKLRLVASVARKTVQVIPFPSRSERSQSKGEFARVEGTIVSEIPYARVVEISPAGSLNSKREGDVRYVVQVSFICGEDRTWSTIESIAPFDGRIFGRKVYENLVTTPAEARASAVAVMRNASQSLSIFVPLVAQAERLRKQRGGPRFSAVQAFIASAQGRVAALQREVSASWKSRSETHRTYGYVPAGLFPGVLDVLTRPRARDAVAVAFDGETLNFYEMPRPGSPFGGSLMPGKN